MSKRTTKQLAGEIVEELRKCSAPAAAAQARTYFKEPVTLMGVTTPQVRRIAREAYARIRKDWGQKQALELCAVLLPDKRLEVKAAALFVCECFRKSFDPSLLLTVHDWIERGLCNNWGTIDFLCSAVLGPLLEKHPELVIQTKNWTSSPNRWLRRAAVVSLTGPARKGSLLDDAYDIAGHLLCDADDLVQKACGWLLREAGKTDMQRLERFLHQNGSRCARTTLRYAIERFPENKRRDLLVRTRSKPAPENDRRGKGSRRSKGSLFIDEGS